MHRPSTSTIIASTALFFSLVGTGLAAKGTHPTPAPTHYVITTTKQIKPSVISSLHGSQGPRGVAGAQGPAGAAGAAGAAGPAGNFTATESLVTGASTGIGASAQATSVASCPTGTSVIGGGYSWGLGTIPANVTVVTDSPQGTGGWAVTIQNNTGAAISTQFVAQALCAA